MPRKHADGRLLDDRGNAIGRWDDNKDGVRQWAISHNQDPDAAEEAWRKSGQSCRPVVKRVEGYYEANKHKASGGKNWLRVLVAFGQYRERGIKPYSAAEARESAKVWRGWEEVALALEGLESANYEYAHGYDPKGSVYQQDGTDGYVAPDDERWGNKRQAQAEDVTNHDPEPEVAPEHKDRFVAWLQVEREVTAKNSGASHPVVKHDVFGKMIERVEAGEYDSEIAGQYEQFVGWLDGKWGQIQPDGSISMGDESDDAAGGTRLDQGDPAPEFLSRDAYEAEAAKQMDVLRDDYRSQPALASGPPPPPVIEHIELFPPRNRKERNRPWIGFVVGPKRPTKGGNRAWETHCEMLTTDHRGGETWVGRPGSQAVPVQPRFAHLHRQRGAYEDSKGKWRSVLPWGRYNPAWKQRASIFESYPTPDGKQVRIRFWNKGINGIKGVSEKVEKVLDIPAEDPHRGLKRIGLPVAIADALEAEDWALVAKLANERT